MAISRTCHRPAINAALASVSALCNADLLRQFANIASYQGEFDQITAIQAIRSACDVPGSRTDAKALLYILCLTRNAQASDPRDRIFSLLGLTRSVPPDEFKPDYILSVEEVCKLTLLHLFKVMQNLRPLLRWHQKTLDLPLWVPDSTASQSHVAPVPLITQDRCTKVAHAAAGRQSALQYQVDASCRRLHLNGVIFDVVNRRSDKLFKIDEDRLQPYKDLELAAHDLRQHLDRQEPLWHIVTAGQVDDFYAPRPRFRKGIYPRLCRMNCTTKSSYRWQRTFGKCRSIMEGRSVFVSRTGFIGIGPNYETRAYNIIGAIVAIIYGSEVPFLLEKHGTWHKLIGECYASGIMKGEFMELCSKYKGQPGCPEEQVFELR